MPSPFSEDFLEERAKLQLILEPPFSEDLLDEKNITRATIGISGTIDVILALQRFIVTESIPISNVESGVMVWLTSQMAQMSRVQSVEDGLHCYVSIKNRKEKTPQMTLARL